MREKSEVHSTIGSGIKSSPRDQKCLNLFLWFLFLLIVVFFAFYVVATDTLLYCLPLSLGIPAQDCLKDGVSSPCHTYLYFSPTHRLNLF